MKKMLSVSATAEKFGLSCYEVRSGLKKGKYPGIKIGVGRGKYLIDEELFAEALTRLALDNMSAAHDSSSLSNDGKGKIVKYGQLRRIDE